MYKGMQDYLMLLLWKVKRLVSVIYVTTAVLSCKHVSFCKQALFSSTYTKEVSIWITAYMQLCFVI